MENEIINELLNIFQTIGIWGLIVVGLLYILIIRTKNKNTIDSNRADTNNQIGIMESESKIVTQVAEIYEHRFLSMEQKIDALSDKISKYSGVHTVEDEKQNLQINEYIDDALQCLLTKTGAQRAYYFRFHNGERSIDSFGFQKMSISNEQTVSWVSPIIGECQNLQRAMLSSVYSTMIKQDTYLIDDIENLKEKDPVSYNFFRSHGTKKIFMHSLKRNDGLVTGFIAVEYVGDIDVDLKFVTKYLEKKALKITGAFLGNYDFKKEEGV